MGQSVDVAEQLLVHEREVHRLLASLEALRMRALEAANEALAREVRDMAVYKNAQLMKHRIAIALLHSRMPDSPESRSAPAGHSLQHQARNGDVLDAHAPGLEDDDLRVTPPPRDRAE